MTKTCRLTSNLHSVNNSIHDLSADTADCCLAQNVNKYSGLLFSFLFVVCCKKSCPTFWIVSTVQSKSTALVGEVTSNLCLLSAIVSERFTNK